MDFFDPNQYLKLKSAIKKSILDGDAEAMENLQFLKRAVLSFINYVAKVGEERVERNFADGVLKAAEYRQVVESFDLSRHNAHEQAIVNTRIINRMAASYGIQNIFLGDQENRREVGRFCGEFSNWVFVNRYA